MSLGRAKWLAILAISVGLTAALLNIRFPSSERLLSGELPVDEGAKEPNEQFHWQRAFPLQDIPDGAYATALKQARELDGGHSRSGEVSWTASGPTNIGGRITALVVHPQNHSTMWVGAADGGVLRTTNSGVTWTPLLDDWGSLSVGAIAIHPKNPDFLLVGTGEANAAGDCYDGIGILKTTNGGDTWTEAGLPNSRRIGRIVFDPGNPERIHVAVSGAHYSTGPDRGMYRSTNSGDTWEQTLFVSDSTCAIDVVIHPTDGNILYAAFWERIRTLTRRMAGGPTSRIWKSTDGGDHWAELSNGLPSPGPTVGRIGLALSASSPSTLCAIYANHPGYFAGVYKTTNAGDSWWRVDDVVGLQDLYSDFGWYFGNIRISPSNPNLVIALGVTLRRSTNGGVNWASITGSPHVDFHDLWMDPAGSGLYVSGNDGGVYTSTNSGGSWSKKPNLAITQFYAVTVDPQVPTRIYGGTQDNGTMRTFNGSLADWEKILGGDGFTCIVDPTSSDIIYGESQYGGLAKAINGYAFWSATNGVVSTDRINWHMPYVMQPSDPQRLYLGTQRVYRSTNGAASWAPISPDLTDGPGINVVFGTLSTLAVAASSPGTIYAGSDDGNVHVTTNDGGSWAEIDEGLPKRWITRLAVDPLDAASAYVTLSGFKEDVFLPHVFRTTDFGGAWTDISSNLPEAPVNDVMIDRQDLDRLFVATDVGVFMTNDLGGTWERLGSNLPTSVIVDLELDNATRTLVAGTHGRSTFSISLDDAVGTPRPSQHASTGISLAVPSPNPTSGLVKISFSVPQGAKARLTIHNVAGRTVRTLWNGNAGPSVDATWNGLEENGARAAAGMYFLRLEAQGEIATRTIALVR